MNAASSIAKRVAILSVVVAFAGAIGTLVPGETAAGKSFTSTNLDLKIDSKAWYNGALVPSATWKLKDLVPGTDKFFNFSDVKPGDFGCNVISIHVQKSDAWACIDFKNLKSSDNGVNEPEAAADPNGNASGELAAGTEFFGWLDTNGNGKFEPPGEKALFGTSTQDAAHVLNNTTYVIGDSKSGSSCKQNTKKYVGTCWCAGNLTVNPSTGKMTCDGSALGNAAQTDSFSVDVNIRALPTSQNTKFSCNPSIKGNNGVGNGVDPPPPGIGNAGNDASGTGPGNPGGHDTAPGWHEVSNSGGGFHWPFSFSGHKS